jgi:tetratricopeptide (TPR) repeat protein
VNIRMIPVFSISLREDRYDGSHFRVEGLQIPGKAGDPGLVMELENYDYSLSESYPDSILERLIRLLPLEDARANEVMLKSLILGWKMKYREAIAMLDDSGEDLSGNYLAAFIRGYHNFAIAEIISSIENTGMHADEASTTVRGYYLNALKDFDRSINLNPDFVFSRFNRAYIKSLTDELQGALGDYSACIELSPDLGVAYYNMGLLEIFMHSPETGCPDLSRAGELGIDAAYKVIYNFCKE